jgi:hypothetical protein
MFSDYQARNSSPSQSKAGREYPWIARMRKHCDSYIREAERLAAEAEHFAEFHRMRGEELQGR